MVEDLDGKLLFFSCPNEPGSGEAVN